MASRTTVTSGFELLQKLQQWSINNFKQETILCTIDVADLYTMIPQVGGVLSLKIYVGSFKFKTSKWIKN